MLSGKNVLGKLPQMNVKPWFPLKQKHEIWNIGHIHPTILKSPDYFGVQEDLAWTVPVHQKKCTKKVTHK